MEAVGTAVERSQSGTAVQAVFVASERYLSVYENSGGQLGLVRDENTVDQIVRAYTYLRALSDTFAINNATLQRFESLQAARSTEAGNAHAQLEGYGDIVRETHHKAMSAIGDAQLAIQTYLGEPYGTTE